MRSSIYSDKNTHLYPFLQSVPFPVGFIKNIKIVLKKSKQIPYISSIISLQGQLFVQISTKSKNLGSFVYEDNLFININNQQIYGFIQLSHSPIQVFSYQGTFNIHRSCYVYSVILQGCDSININNQKFSIPRILNIQVEGDASIKVIDNVITIRRNNQDFFNYFIKQPDTTTYVSSVNNNVCEEINIIAQSPSIIISQPVFKNNNYTIYISTDKDFPVCAEQKEDQED